MKLMNFEVGWAKVSFGTIFPGSEAEGVPGIASMDIAGFLAEVCHRVPFKSAMGLRVAIWIAALAPLFVIGRFALLGSLAVVDRERVITTLLASKSYAVRSLVMILKTIGALLYGADPIVRARMYARPPSAATSGQRLVPLRLKGQAA
jgi:hypothetical protein